MDAIFDDWDCSIYYAVAEDLAPDKREARRLARCITVPAGTTIREVLTEVRRLAVSDDVLLLKEKPPLAWIQVPHSALEVKLPKGAELYLKVLPRGLEDFNNASWVIDLKKHFDQVACSFEQVVDVLSKGMILALKPVTGQLRRSPSVAQTENAYRIDSFKKELVKLYLNVDNPTAEIPCYVTGLLLPSLEVIPGHIFPVRAHAMVHDLVPDLLHINDLKNGILWAAPVELAFELSCICFQWDEVRHTLMPIVLDKNIMGKSMYEAVKYMKHITASATNKEEEETLLEVEEAGLLSSEYIKSKMQEISEYGKTMEVSSEKDEHFRDKEYERVFRPHINARYKSVSFDSLHMQQKQFPMQVKMSGRAFKITSLFAFQESKKRGVLPDNLSFNPFSDKAYSDPLDMYLANEASVSDLCDDLIAYDSDF